MNTKEWLAQLQVGDTVVVRTNGIGFKDSLDTVAKRTPSGRIYLTKSDTQYNPNGTSRGTKEDYHGSRIVMPTEKLLYDIKKDQVYRRVIRLVTGKIEWQNLSLEQLEQALITLQQLEEEQA